MVKMVRSMADFPEAVAEHLAVTGTQYALINGEFQGFVPPMDPPGTGR